MKPGVAVADLAQLRARHSIPRWCADAEFGKSRGRKPPHEHLSSSLFVHHQSRSFTGEAEQGVAHRTAHLTPGLPSARGRSSSRDPDSVSARAADRPPACAGWRGRVAEVLAGPRREPHRVGLGLEGRRREGRVGEAESGRRGREPTAPKPAAASRFQSRHDARDVGIVTSGPMAKPVWQSLAHVHRHAAAGSRKPGASRR